MAESCQSATFPAAGVINASVLKGASGRCGPVSMTAGKRTVLALMGESEMGVEDRELCCHRVTNLLSLKPKGAAE